MVKAALGYATVDELSYALRKKEIDLKSACKIARMLPFGEDPVDACLFQEMLSEAILEQNLPQSMQPSVGFGPNALKFSEGVAGQYYSARVVSKGKQIYMETHIGTNDEVSRWPTVQVTVAGDQAGWSEPFIFSYQAAMDGVAKAWNDEVRARENFLRKYGDRANG